MVNPRPDWAKSSSAGRGKYAEDKVREFLKSCAAAKTSFTFNRIQDAGAAQGGMSVAQPGDFQWFCKVCEIELRGRVQPFTRNGVIEVKEVQHGYRLPHKSLNPQQLARLRVRELAGSEVILLVCFRDGSKTLGWRTAAPSYFINREGGSWDMRDIPIHGNLAEILGEHFD